MKVQFKKPFSVMGRQKKKHIVPFMDYWVKSIKYKGIAVDIHFDDEQKTSIIGLATNYLHSVDHSNENGKTEYVVAPQSDVINEETPAPSFEVAQVVENDPVEIEKVEVEVAAAEVEVAAAEVEVAAAEVEVNSQKGFKPRRNKNL